MHVSLSLKATVTVHGDLRGLVHVGDLDEVGARLMDKLEDNPNHVLEICLGLDLDPELENERVGVAQP